MLNCRDELGSSCTQDIPTPEIENIHSYVLKPAVVAQQNMTALMSEEKIDIKNLDEVSKAYILAKDEPRENKIDLLWGLLVKQESNPFKFDYLSDILATLEPIEKTDEMIAAFNKSNNSHLKLKYLSLLISSMTINRANLAPNYIYSGREFLTNLLHTSQDEEILKVMIINYPETIMDESIYLIMSARLDELKNQSPETFKKIVTNSNFWYQWLGLANVDKKFNPVWVEKLFKQYESYSSNKQEAMNSPSLLSKDVLKAFSFGLKARKKQNKAFHLPQSIKMKININQSVFSDDMALTLKRFEEEKAKRKAWIGGKMKITKPIK